MLDWLDENHLQIFCLIGAMSYHTRAYIHFLPENLKHHRSERIDEK